MTFKRPIGMKLDDRLGTSPLFDMILIDPRRYDLEQLQAIGIIAWKLAMPKGRALIRLRRKLRRERQLYFSDHKSGGKN